MGGLFAVFLAGGVALGVSRKQFIADLWLSFEGEAYQAKTLEPMGERASVFSRALLKTGWLPVGETGKLPLEFTKRMEESQLELDLDIAMLLPQFELEPPKIADGKEYYGVLEDRRVDLSATAE